MINITGLTFGYKKQPPLFQNLNLSIGTGSITGLLGKNGAGKTSLLKLLVGLQYPSDGLAKIQDQIPGDRNPGFLSDLYFVPEEFYLPAITINKYIRVNSGLYPRFDQELVLRLLREFELDAEKSINKLSYGQKKKFLICFALATKCRLLALDEPTNGLDIPSKSIFRKVLAGALDEDQLVIISTHQVKDVENLIDKIVILDQGQIILQKDIYDISSQLSFASASSGEGSEVLYSEMVPGGYKVITAKGSGGSIDIEVLFNALTSGIKLFEDEIE